MVLSSLAHLHQENPLDCLEFLVLLDTNTSQNLHKSATHLLLLVELLSHPSYPTGLVLVPLTYLVEMDIIYRHILSPVVVCLRLVVQQRESHLIITYLLQMYLVQKIGVCYLKLQLQPKTLLRLLQEIQRFTTMELYSMEIKPTQHLDLHSCLVSQLLLDSGSQHTLDQELCSQSVELQTRLFKQTTPLDCSASQVLQTHHSRSDMYPLEFCLRTESSEKQLPSLTIFLLLSHLHQKIMVWSQQMQPAPKIMVL